MIARVLLPGLFRLCGALGLNVLLLAALMHLNRLEPVQAEPEVVARLRFAEPRPVERMPEERPFEREPDPDEIEDPDDLTLPEPERPVPELEPLALSCVLPMASVPVVVRPVPRPVASIRPRAGNGDAARGVSPPTAEPQRVAQSDEVDEAPRELRLQSPEYPSYARRRGIEGSATVRLLIDEQGRVVEVRLVDTRGSDRFGEAVLAVAKRWVFRPARDEGHAVRVWALKTVRFRMENRW